VWLEQEGLNELGALARRLGYDGACLYALYRAKNYDAFKSYCEALGITDRVMQVKLNGNLYSLFD